MLQSLLQALSYLLRGDRLQIGGGEDPVDDGRVLRPFCWKDLSLLAINLLTRTPLRCSRRRGGRRRQLTRHLALRHLGGKQADRKQQQIPIEQEPRKPVRRKIVPLCGLLDNPSAKGKLFQ